MLLSARAIALQGLAAPFALSPIAMAVQGLFKIQPEEPTQPPGIEDDFNRPIGGGGGHTFKPAPLPRRYQRRKRQNDIIFL